MERYRSVAGRVIVVIRKYPKNPFLHPRHWAQQRLCLLIDLLQILKSPFKELKLS